PPTDGYFTGFMDSDPNTSNQSRFNHPVAITQGYDGTIYVADSLNCRIRKMPDSTGDPASPTIGNAVVSTLGGQNCGVGSAPWGDGGPVTNAQFDNPSGVSMSP